MSPPFKGSCLCGEVHFTANAEPVIVSCCHCSNCKKYTGTVFTTNVVFPTNCITITKGQDLVSIFKDEAQDSGNSLERHFCSKCGSPLYNLGGDFGRTCAVFYSALDGFDHGPPKVEYYSKDRVDWLPEIEGTERPRTKPGRED